MGIIATSCVSVVDNTNCSACGSAESRKSQNVIPKNGNIQVVRVGKMKNLSDSLEGYYSKVTKTDEIDCMEKEKEEEEKEEEDLYEYSYVSEMIDEDMYSKDTPVLMF